MSIIEIQEPPQSERPKRLAVGIDLGTTHSLIAIEIDNKVTVLSDETGELLPSVVRYTQNNAPSVGLDAKNYIALDPQNTLASIKRLMGRAPCDVKAQGVTLPYQFVDESSSICALQTVAGNVTPIQVSAQILKKLMERAHKIDETISNAVITVPAYFDEAQRQATKDAAKLAGINVLRLINEPTAAALAYGLERKALGNCLVFDLGGGTFDISLLKLSNGLFEVIATRGDTALGGDDIDHLVAKWIIAQLPPSSAFNYSEVLIEARKAKEALNTLENTEILISLEAWQGKLTLSTFNQLIEPLIAKALVLCDAVLKDANLKVGDIAQVVLVGGSTRIKTLREKVSGYFQQELLIDIDPDKTVALGAAIQASQLMGNRSENKVLLLDVIPLSLGVEMIGGVVEKLLMRNTTLPALSKEIFTTFKDGQTGLSLHIVQGERELAKDCRSLAKFDLLGLPSMPAGKARIEVTFRVDADGLLSIEATEQTTGISSEITVQPTYGLQAEEIHAFIKDSIEHAAEDIALRKWHEKAIEATALLEYLESALVKDRALLSLDELNALQQDMENIRLALKGKDISHLNQSLKTITHLANTFAESRLNATLQNVLAGKSLNDIESTLL